MSDLILSLRSLTCWLLYAHNIKDPRQGVGELLCEKHISPCQSSKSYIILLSEVLLRELGSLLAKKLIKVCGL